MKPKWREVQSVSWPKGDGSTTSSCKAIAGPHGRIAPIQHGVTEACWRSAKTLVRSTAHTCEGTSTTSYALRNREKAALGRWRDDDATEARYNRDDIGIRVEVSLLRQGTAGDLWGPVKAKR